MELLIARNPDPESRLPYLLRLPLRPVLLFRTSGTWPRTTALYCYPVPLSEWPEHPELVERVQLRSCVHRGAAIDLVLDRGRENRSQIVFTTARDRDAVFWQSPRTRKKARPNVRTPTARASGLVELEIVVDSHERYGYRFAGKPVQVVRRALPCGDYGVVVDGRLAAAVERKSLADLVSSLTGGQLGFAIGELSALPRAAVVVEERYSDVFRLDRVRPATVADGLAELQVRWPNVPIVVLRDPPARRGVGLSLSGRRPRVGGRRARGPQPRRSGRRRARERPGRSRAVHGGGPSMGAYAGNRRSRPRPTTPQGVGGMAGRATRT